MSTDAVPAAEHPGPETLVVDGVDLHPTRYQETLSGHELTINAIAIVPVAADKRLRKHMKEHSSFSVVRRGISDTPITMSFGTCAWSPHAEGTKYSLVLREEKPGVDPVLSAHAVAEYRRQDILAYRAGFSEELARLLVSNGTISQEELDGVRRRADASVGDRMLDWLEVRDVDELR